MKNNLGKIVLLLLFIPYIINAAVLLKAPDTFYKGDVISFSITATGVNVKMPDINTIDGNTVQNAGTSQKTTIINGSRTYQLEKSYIMSSSKDITIPSFDILVDNTIQKTQAKIIKMLKVEKTKSYLYDLSISIDKKEVYVGEAVEFTLNFKYKKDLDIVNLDFKTPDFENFWVKEIKTNQKQDNFTQYVEQELKYLLFPQKAGDIELGSLKIIISTAQSGYGYYQSSQPLNTPVYSNKLHLKVKALPKAVNLIGDFDIKSTLDKTTIKQGEAVSYKLHISGRGNIDDLDEVVLNIPQATIYENPSKKEYNIQNKKYGGTYTKTYSIVAKEDFTIPKIEIQYFDKKSLQIKTITTKSYDIEVAGVPKVDQKLEVQEPKQKNVTQKIENVEIVQVSNDDKIIYFVLGLLTGICLMIVYILLKQRNKKIIETPLMKTVKQSKTPNELFKVLLVYINIDEELDKIIYKLEHISQEEYKIEKKNILKILSELLKKDIRLDT
jgi:hypothetical protein